MRIIHENRWTSIEIIFILSIVIIVIGNFFLLNAFSAENNTFAKTYVRATQLVQERIRVILDIHEKKMDKLIIVDNHFYSWKQIFDKSVIFPSCTDLLDPTTNCGDFILSNCPSGFHTAGGSCIIKNKKPYTDGSWMIKKEIALFSQKIRIVDAGPKAKKITVFIWWYDSLGLRKSVITRELKIQ